MKTRIKRIWTAILGSILSLLGFSACFEMRAEYGCPHADFTVIGEATSEGKPVPGIRVVIAPNGFDTQYVHGDTLYTDANGRVQREMETVGISESMAVKFEDVDGPENGSFKTKVLKEDQLERVQTRKGDGKWYDGAFTVTAKAELEKE